MSKPSIIEEPSEDDPQMSQSVMALFSSVKQQRAPAPVGATPEEQMSNGKKVGLDGFEELNVDELEEQLKLIAIEENAKKRIGSINYLLKKVSFKKR